MGRPVQIAAIHGVNTGAIEQQRFHREWQDTLCAAAGSGSYEVTGIPWPSIGTAAGDGLRLFWDVRAREAAIASVVYGLKRWLEKPGPRVIVAHSMGTVLVLEALRVMGGGVPIVGIGSPATHPLLARRLAFAGYLRSVQRKRRPTTIQNKDDGVCALRLPFGGRLTMASGAYLSEWIDVEPDKPVGWAAEHGADLYLAHETTLRAIESEVADYGRAHAASD